MLELPQVQLIYLVHIVPLFLLQPHELRPLLLDHKSRYDLGPLHRGSQLELQVSEPFADGEVLADGERFEEGSFVASVEGSTEGAGEEWGEEGEGPLRWEEGEDLRSKVSR